MTETPATAPEVEPPAFDPVRSQAVIDSLRRRLSDAVEETVLLGADLTILRAQVEGQSDLISQISADNLRLRSKYEPDSILEGTGEEHHHDDVQDHGDGAHTH